MNIGFDFDGTLKGNEGLENFIKLMSPIINQQQTFLLTSRDEITPQVINHVRELGLNINTKRMFAMGLDLSICLAHSKAEWIGVHQMKCDLFFDNDPWEIDALRKAGIPCIWVPEMNKDSLMWELTEKFFSQRINETTF